MTELHSDDMQAGKGASVLTHVAVSFPGMIFVLHAFIDLISTLSAKVWSLVTSRMQISRAGFDVLPLNLNLGELRRMDSLWRFHRALEGGSNWLNLQL